MAAGRELQQRLGGARASRSTSRRARRDGASPPTSTSWAPTRPGIVYAVGSEVTNVAVGDRVVVHAGQWDEDDPWVRAGKDPGLAASFRVWGYDTLLGLVRAVHQGAGAPVPAEGRPPHVGGGGRADPHRVAPPTACSSAGRRTRWSRATSSSSGARSGGLGSLAVQLVANAGGRAVAVVRSDEKGEYAKRLGAVGYVNRKDFDHWGVPPRVGQRRSGRTGSTARRRSARRSGTCWARRRARGSCSSTRARTRSRRRSSCADRGGMVVICAGTSGYDTMVDVRYLWYMQKRYQGSHLFNDEQAAAFNDLVVDGQDPDDARRDLPVRRDRPRAPADGRRDASRGQRQRPGERARARASTDLPLGATSAFLDRARRARRPSSRGCTNAISVSRIPARGASSISRTPSSRSCVERGRDVVAPGTRRDAGPGRARRGTGPTGRVGPERAEQLDVRRPDGEQHLLDALVVDPLPVRGLDAEQAPVVGDGRLEVGARRCRRGRCR